MTPNRTQIQPARVASVLRLLALLIVTSVILIPHASYAGDGTWTTTGPYSRQIGGVLIDPADSNTMYAYMFMGSVRVFKSTDAGETWFPSSTGIPETSAGLGNNDGLAFDLYDTHTLYLATEKGLYRTTNAGQSWELKSTIVEDGKTGTIPAGSVAVSQVDGAIYIGATIAVEPSGLTTIQTGGVFISRDKGETWARLSTSTPRISLEHFVIAPSAPNVMYGGGMQVGSDIVKSTDGGRTWQSIGSAFGSSPPVTAITVDPRDSQLIYVAVTNVGLFRTADGGATWRPIGTGLNTDARTILIDPNNQQVIYVGGAFRGVPGVYRSLDSSGTTWTPFMQGMGSPDTFSLAIDRNNPSHIFAGSMAGIWKQTLRSDPPDYGISVNHGALFANQAAVELSFMAPPGTTQMQISNDGGFVGSQWESFKTSKAWTMTTYSNTVLPRIVYARFRTNGQTTSVYQDDIVVDTTPPQGSVTIMESPQALSIDRSPIAVLSATSALSSTTYLPISLFGVRPGYHAILLGLSASDNLSGVDQMLIANDATFTGATWQAFGSKLRWDVSGQGPTTIYVKYRDRAGNVSPVYSTTTQSPAASADTLSVLSSVSL